MQRGGGRRRIGKNNTKKGGAVKEPAQNAKLGGEMWAKVAPNGRKPPIPEGKGKRPAGMRKAILTGKKSRKRTVDRSGEKKKRTGGWRARKGYASSTKARSREKEKR